MTQTEIITPFAAAKTEAADLLRGLTYQQFNWRPAPGQWSIAECLLHLNIVGDHYSHLLETTLAEARAQGLAGAATAPRGWFAKWILSNTEPPPKRKFKVPRSFTPPDDQPVTAVLPTFLHLQDQLTERAQQADGLDFDRIKIPVRGLGPIRFNLALTFAWLAAHQRRHLWQARQVRANAAFPKS